MIRAGSIGGALWLRPGEARPHNLRSTRPDWVGRLTRGLPAARLPGTVGSLFTLCSHAHIACAGLALTAALGGDARVTVAAREALALQTLREHLRRLWLDWPRQLATPVPAGADDAIDTATDPAIDDAAARALASCPAFARTPSRATSADWLRDHLLGMPAADWLGAWERDPAGLDAWCTEHRGGLSRCLRDARRVAHEELPAAPALRVHADANDLRDWVESLRRDAGTVTRQPRWRNACAETGVWTRRHERAPGRLNTAWLRLGARLAEVVRLALPDEHERCGAAWLDLGALALAEGEAIAWVEMARGLLMHHVQLDGRGDAARVVACHVIAPTEWNFHPEGAVAAVLERLPRTLTAEGQRRLDAVVAAYDPCVPIEQEAPMPEESAHA